jgi:hypothetical protein
MSLSIDGPSTDILDLHFFQHQWGCVAVTSNSDKQTEFLISLSPISAVWFLMKGNAFLKGNAF